MLEYIKAPNLKNFTHGFFKRKGGVSGGIYNSLNCGLSSQDKKSNIIKNRKIISESLNFNFKNLVIANQSHSNKVEIVNRKACCDDILCTRRRAPIYYPSSDLFFSS